MEENIFREYSEFVKHELGSNVKCMITPLCLVGCDDFVVTFWFLTQDTVLNSLFYKTFFTEFFTKCIYTIKCSSETDISFMIMKREGVPFGNKCLPE